MLGGKHVEGQMAFPLPLRPQPEIEWHLLNLLHLRGRVATQMAYRALAERLRLTAEELAVTIYPERPESAWANECRFAMRRLKDEGYALTLSRGVWAITRKGREIAERRGLEYRSMTLTAEELGL
jgi:restriction endonuclease Mrr